MMVKYIVRRRFARLVSVRSSIACSISAVSHLNGSEGTSEKGGARLTKFASHRSQVRKGKTRVFETDGEKGGGAHVRRRVRKGLQNPHLQVTGGREGHNRRQLNVQFDTGEVWTIGTGFSVKEKTC
jgi:hypothetical protein